MALEAEKAAIPEADATLLTIAIVFRVVGLVWLIVLSTVSLATGGVDEQAAAQGRDLVVVAGVGAIFWTVVTAVVWRLAPWRLGTMAWLIPDLVIGCAVALVPQSVGASSFFVGGFPISSAMLWATTRGVTGAAIAALAVALASIRGYGGQQAARSAEVFAINWLAPVVVGWGFGVIRRNDASRRRAEAELASERAERVRVAERAEVAAHLHDSVLQTLALIQRRAGDRSEVMRLARSQERDLRSWINGTEQRTEGLMDRIRQAAAEVERDFGIAVDLSTVGDTDLAREVEAVAAATREALVNAAKFAGVDRIYVLAESRQHEVRVVVRDRGTGFDLAAIDGDRRGIVESIEGRMARHGGSATISSRPGEGTEVDIRLPRGEP
jgi:signal transduction histidine kinase